MNAHLFLKGFINQGSSPDLASFFNARNDAGLKDLEQNNCERQVTEKECLEALKSKDSRKSPGTEVLLP